MAKMTEAEKATRKIEQAFARKVAKAAVWQAKVDLKQIESLLFLSEKDRDIFTQAFESYKEIMCSATPVSDLERSIFNQFNCFGNLSEKQVMVIINHIKSEKKAKSEAVFYDDFKVNDKYDFTLKLVSHKIEEQSTMYDQYGSINVFRFVNDANQSFKMKTNSKKLIELFTEEGKWYSINTRVKFISVDKRYISLSTVSMKFKEVK